MPPAQLMQIQASVERKTLSSQDGMRQLMNPVELKGGSVKSITITVPLGDNIYLVSRVPPPAVDALLKKLGGMPPEQRADFVNRWLRLNQKDIQAQNKGEKRFSYALVSFEDSRLAGAFKPSTAVSTPRRVMDLKPPVAAVVPVARKQEKKELPPLPAEIKGGTGTKDRPYSIVLAAGRQESTGKVKAPLSLTIKDEYGGTVVTLHFVCDFTLSQISRSAGNKTAEELRRVFGQAARRWAAENNPPNLVDFNNGLRDALQRVARSITDVQARASAADPDFAKYIETH